MPFGNVTRDLGFGLRSLRKRPGLALVAVLSLGLGIGANTTVFTWLDTFILHPLPAVPHSDRLVQINTRGPEDASWSLSYPNFRDWRSGSRTLDIAVARFLVAGLRRNAEIERVWGMAVSGNYFDVLRVPPLLGRTLGMEDETQAAPVAVLGYGFWRDRFAGDSSVIGRALEINGHSLTVIGVAPPRFGGTIVGLSFDMYVPATLEPALSDQPNHLNDRGWQSYDATGRIRDGYTMAQAREELDGLARRGAAETGDDDAKGVLVVPFGEQGAASILRPALVALLGITVVVLLIACSNVANILLARAVARRREIGIRLALGASRWRLVRQLLSESALLAAFAGVVGLVITSWSRDLMYAFVPPAPFPIGFSMDLNGRVLGFTVALSALTVLGFGLIPALQASKAELVPALKDEIGEGRGGRRRLQNGLIVGQVALSLVALAAAGLFIRSLQQARRVNTGFSDPEHVLLVSSDLSLASLGDSAGVVEVERLLARLRAIPGVTAAGAATFVPLGFGGHSSSGTEIDGYVPSQGENMSVERSHATPGYFAAMGIPILEGREFTDADRAHSQPVAIVNEAFVQHYWHGGPAVGRRLKQGGNWLTVVGVAKQGRYHEMSEAPMALVYRAEPQSPDPHLTIHIRTLADPRALIGALRAAFHEVDPNLPFLDVRTMAEHMQAAVFAQRMAAWMLAAFGVLALLLSGLGIYGVLAHLVTQRTREIGVRIALGAARADVVRMVVGRAMRLAGIGVLLGLGLALAVGRLLQSQLLGVSPRDPLTFVAIALLLALVASVASWIPARRASRVDPMIALRSE